MSYFELNNVILRLAKPFDGDKRLRSLMCDLTTSRQWSRLEKVLSTPQDYRSQFLKNFQDHYNDEVNVAMDSAMPWEASPVMLSLVTAISSTHKLYAIGNLPRGVLDETKNLNEAL